MSQHSEDSNIQRAVHRHMERKGEEETLILHVMEDGKKRATAFPLRPLSSRKIKLFSYGKMCPYVPMDKKVSRFLSAL